MIMKTRRVYIVAAKRTPIGSFGGTLTGIPAVQLGAIAIQGALKSISLSPNKVEEVLMGNVLQANEGQAPARQAAKLAGLPDSVVCTTVNKVCASGMKAIIQGAQSILLGDRDIVVAGGMESMSRVPFYVETNRWGAKFGSQQLIDGLEKDGLTDAYGQYSMGICGERCAHDYQISRTDQDSYAIRSYKRAELSWREGKFQEEIVPVPIPSKKGETVFAEDEEYKKVIYDKIPQLKPAFLEGGSLTAANSSTLNDGAAAVVLMSPEKAEELGITPLAILTSYGEAAQAPDDFTTTPQLAIKQALQKAALELDDIDYFEVNEAYSVVALANAQLLDINLEKVNVRGGAVALGHPLGCSGARIVVTLTHLLRQEQGRYGIAAICNGGGGASALIIEKPR